MFKTPVEPWDAGEWFHFKVLNILWRHFMVYESVDPKKCCWLFYSIAMESPAHMWQLVRSQFFYLKPPNVKIMGNFAPIVLLTFYDLLDFVLWKSFDNFKSSFSKLSLHCITCYVISQSIQSSDIPPDQQAPKKSLSYGIIAIVFEDRDIYSVVCFIALVGSKPFNWDLQLQDLSCASWHHFW